MSAGIMYYDHRRVVGIPAAAIRLGRLLELWGRRAGRPIDREEARRLHEHDRHLAEHRLTTDRAMVLRVF